MHRRNGFIAETVLLFFIAIVKFKKHGKYSVLHRRRIEEVEG